MRVRWVFHKMELNRGVHSSATMQADWKKYGKSAFVLEPLHFSESREERFEIEQKILDEGTAFGAGGYNTSRYSNSTRGTRRTLADRIKFSVAHLAVSRREAEQSEANERRATRSRAVERLSPDGVVIGSYRSGAAAARALGVHRSIVCAAAKSPGRVAAGSLWRYVE